MVRKLPKRADIEALLERFGAAEGGVLLDEPGFEADLAIALRVTLLVGLALDSIGDDPASHFDAIDMLRGDIRAGIEAFEHVESVAWDMSGIEVGDWPWPASLSWEDLTSHFSRELGVLGSPDVLLQKRYATLVRLIRLQLALWGLTFGVAADGYIGGE